MTKPLNEKIAELRKARSLTQEKLGEQLGVTSQAVSRWEKGDTMPDIMILPQLCEILGISIDALLEMPAEVKKDHIMKDLADYAKSETDYIKSDNDSCKVICEAFDACLYANNQKITNIPSVTGSTLVSSKGINAYDKSGIGFVLHGEETISKIQNTDEKRIKDICEILSDLKVISIIKILSCDEAYSEDELAEKANLTVSDVEHVLFKLSKFNFCGKNGDNKYSFCTNSYPLFVLLTGFYLTAKETREMNFYKGFIQKNMKITEQKIEEHYEN